MYQQGSQVYMYNTHEECRLQACIILPVSRHIIHQISDSLLRPTFIPYGSDEGEPEAFVIAQVGAVMMELGQ